MSERCQKEPARAASIPGAELLSFPQKPETNKCCKERALRRDCARENPATCYATCNMNLNVKVTVVREAILWSLYCKQTSTFLP